MFIAYLNIIFHLMLFFLIIRQLKMTAIVVFNLVIHRPLALCPALCAYFK